MAFQALLFCPDDKTARTVTQVLGELEFTVEACTEPFAAVKKLMSQHFDALVVDCDNEQNATLLFKSARNSTSNQASLAVAIVEGQAGVAKTFRIGANLVLTKPINVEQSKGTLRVARGLLRKGEPAKPVATAPAVPVAAPAAPIPPPAPAAPIPPPVAAAPALPVKPAPTKPLPPAKPAPTVAAAPVVARQARAQVPKPAISVAEAQAAASSGLAPQSEIDNAARISAATPAKAPVTAPVVPPELNRITPPAPPAPKPPAAPPPVSASRPVFVGAPEGPAGSFSGGTASAPAPAREAPVVPAPEAAPLSVPHKGGDLFEKPAEPAPSASPVATAVSPVVPAPSAAPSFTFGGANASEESGGGKKKIMLGIAAAVLLAAGLYAGWNYFQGRASQPANHVPAVSTPSTATPSSAQPAPPKPAASIPVPNSHPAAQPAASDAPPTANPENSEPAAEVSTPAEPRTSASPANSSPASKSAPPVKPAETPLIVKGGSVPVVKSAPAAPDTPAPNVIGMAATGSGGALSNLIDTTETGPKPILQKLNISQGVSQGLLMKKVQPVYPRTALAMRVEGVVELAATISKTGDITSVKVVKGDPQLTHAATDAVKQWKYKPYLLNGEPVEITTEVTISFKLPH